MPKVAQVAALHCLLPPITSHASTSYRTQDTKLLSNSQGHQHFGKLMQDIDQLVCVMYWILRTVFHSIRKALLDACIDLLMVGSRTSGQKVDGCMCLAVSQHLVRPNRQQGLIDIAAYGYIR